MDNVITYIVIFILLIFITKYLFSSQKQNKETFRDLLSNMFTKHESNSFVHRNKNLDNILDQFSTLIYDPSKKLNNPTESYIETENNLNTDLKLEIEKVINKLLKTLNDIHNVKYKFLHIERVKVERNILRDNQVSVIFLLFEEDKFSSRKVFVQYRKSSANKIHINYTNTIQSDLDLNNIRPYNYINNSTNHVFDKLIVDRQLELLHETNEGLYKCEHNLKMNFASEPKDVCIKLSKNCSITNPPSFLPDPFINPTQFVLL